MNKIRVNLDRKSSLSYDLHIGENILDRAGLIMVKNHWASRYLMITDSNVSALHGGRVLETLRSVGLQVEMLDFPAGESSKNMKTCVEIAVRMAELGMDRTSAVIALGGGVVGDVAGFIASIYMRGIPCIQFPTTLLAMVDSSIGGKTGVDIPEGKNLLGTFHQPKAVFMDLAFLQTLAPREFSNGVAEIVKHGFIDDVEILDMIEDGKERLLSRDKVFVEGLISKSCRIKKGIVEIDETEKGVRRLLNFGHTIGHAVEAESGYAVSHGEAVSMGMSAAAVLSEKMKYLSPQDREKVISLIENAGLPTRIPAGLSTDGIMAHMKIDKKKTGDTIHFVLLKKPGMPFVNGGVPDALVRQTIEGLKK